MSNRLKRVIVAYWLILAKARRKPRLWVENFRTGLTAHFRPWYENLKNFSHS